MDAPERHDRNETSRIPYARLAALFVGSRLLIYATAWVALAKAPKGPYFTPPARLSDWFLRWDAQWYWDIIRNGYHFDGNGTSNIGFFPLYPWIGRVFTLGGLIAPRTGGYIAALVGLWLACVLLWRLVEREWNEPRLATAAVVFLLFNPVSFFFSTLYSESWFLPLTIGCVLAARTGRWWVAGALGALAAFTRFVGVALVVPLFWEWFDARYALTRSGGRCSVAAAPSDNAGRTATSDAGAQIHSATLTEPRSPRVVSPWFTLVACLLPLAGYGAYCVLMWVKFGNPFMYAQANIESGRHFTWFWGLLARPSFTGLSPFYQLWFGGTVFVAFAVLLAGVLLRIPTTYAIYVLTFGYIYISARFVDSLPRYFAGLFPMYVALALIGRRWHWTEPVLLVACIALQILSVTLFVNGYWFT